MKKELFTIFFIVSVEHPNMGEIVMTGQNQKQKITSKVLQKNTMQPCAHIKSLIIPKFSDGSATGQAKALH